LSRLNFERMDLVLSGCNEVPAIRTPTYHLSQLSFHGAPLKDTDNHGAQTKEGDSQSKADHPPIYPFQSIVNLSLEFLYLGLHILVGGALCLWANRIVWRWANQLLGLGLVNALIVYGLLVTQNVLDMP
jgi:hypothetical protein